MTPLYAEVYTFTLVIDSFSTGKLLLGGVGTALNGSLPVIQGVGYGQEVVIDTTGGTGGGAGAGGGSGGALGSGSFGSYNFTDMSPREVVLEYVHYQDDSLLQLYWQSPSTPYDLVRGV